MKSLSKALEDRMKKMNRIEQIKVLSDTIEVYTRLSKIADGGYEALKEEDSSYFLKCLGLFDKGKDFMIRVHILAGELSYEQALCIGELAYEYGDDYMDITTRMQIELRHIEISNIAKVVKRLEEVGLSTFQTGGDNPRNIMTDPLDGIAYDNIIETMPIIEKLQEVFFKNPQWTSALPHKFNTAILGSLSNSCNIFGHDCSFVLAQKEGLFGFNVFLGARGGIQSQDANLFLEIDQVPLFFESLLSIFKKYGYRDDRTKSRLIFLLRDVGMKNLIEGVEEEAGVSFAKGGVTLVQSQSMTFGSNKVLGKDGKFIYKLIVPSGIFTGKDMIAVAQIAQKFGSGNIRLSYDQNIYLLSLEQESFEIFKAQEVIRNYAHYNRLYFNDMIACVGDKNCSFGLISNKSDAIEMAEFLYHEIPIEDALVRINWSACAKGCGLHKIADIGLQGCEIEDAQGEYIEGVDIFFGGKITRDALEAKILHQAVPLREAKYHIKYLLQAYKEFKKRGESYEAYDSRYLRANYSIQAISFYTKINYILNQKLKLASYLQLDAEPKTAKKEELELFDFGNKLFMLLTGQKRYIALENFEPVLIQPRRISKDEVSKLNPKVPQELSELIYTMTYHKKIQRAQVFSELLVVLERL